MFPAGKAELGKKYLTKYGIPVVVTGTQDGKIKVTVEGTDNSCLISDTHLLYPYDPSKVSRDMKIFKMLNKDESKKEGVTRNRALTKRELVKSKDTFSTTWKGTIYIAQRKGKEFVYNNKVYNSLTAIAREITGKQVISGPNFFKVK